MPVPRGGREQVKLAGLFQTSKSLDHYDSLSPVGGKKYVVENEKNFHDTASKSSKEKILPA
jgi:hypothetical protein